LPNHYLIFTLSSELLANKVVIKIFQNYDKFLDLGYRVRKNKKAASPNMDAAFFAPQ